MKTKTQVLSFVQKDNGFIINNTQLTKDDLFLLLEMAGYEADCCETEFQFCLKTIKTLQEIELKTLHWLLRDIKAFDQQTKDQLRHALAVRQILDIPVCEN